MKRNYLFISIGAALLLLLSASSCGNLQLPETVSVKTNARFQAPLGTARYKLDPETIRQTVQDALGDNASIYTYAKDGNDDVLRYLIHFSKQLNDLPFNPNEFLENLNLEEKLGNLDGIGSEPQTFTAGQPMSDAKSFEINVEDVTNQLFDHATFECPSSAPLTEGSWTFEPKDLPQVNVANGTDDLTFSRLYYSSGYVQITMTRTDSNPVTSGYKLEMKAYLVPSTFNMTTGNPDTECITKANNGEWQDIIANPTLTIPLDVAQGLPKDFMFVFKAKGTGGNSSNSPHEFQPSASYQDLKIKKVTGLNSTNGVELPEETLPLDLVGNIPYIKEVEFENATITAQSNNLSGWSGARIFFKDGDLKLTGTSGALESSSINCTSSNTSGSYLINDTYKASAKIKTDTGGTVSVYVKPSLKLKNAVIDFGDDGNSNQKIVFSFGYNLKKIKEAKVDLSGLGITGFSLPTSGSDAVPLDDIKQYVNSISFTEYKTNPDGTTTTTPRKGFGLKCAVTNTLPAGNDISIDLKILKNGSTGFDKTVTIPSNSNEATVEWTQKPCTIEFPDDKDYLDLSADIQNLTNFTLKNIELGKEYSIGFELSEIICDWDSVNLNLTSLGRFGDPIDLPLNISELIKNFPNMENEIQKIEIQDFPFYMYAKGGALKDLLNGLEGRMFISYKDGTTKYLDLMTENSTPQASEPDTDKDINFFDFDLPFPSDKSKLLVANASNSNNIAHYYDDATIKANLKDILTLANASEVKLNYDIGIKNPENKTIYQSSLSSSESEMDMSVDLVTILSFDFGLTAPISLNIMEIADEHYNEPDAEGKYKDLLNRSEISSTTEYDEYMDYIKSVGINYQLVNKLFMNDEDHRMDINIKIDDLSEPVYTGIHKELVLNPGRTDVEFTKDEVKNVMTKIFHPNITIKLGRTLEPAEEISGGHYISNPAKLTVSRKGLEDKDALSANILVYVQMDGDHPISVWGGHE